MDLFLFISFCCFLLLAFFFLLDWSKKNSLFLHPQPHGGNSVHLTHWAPQALDIDSTLLRKNFFDHSTLFRFDRYFLFALHTDRKINDLFSQHQTITSPSYKKLLQSTYKVDPIHDHSFTNFSLPLSMVRNSFPQQVSSNCLIQVKLTAVLSTPTHRRTTVHSNPFCTTPVCSARFDKFM